MNNRRPMLILFAWMLLLMTLPAQAQDNPGCGSPLAMTPGMRFNTRPGIYIRNLPTRSGAIAEYLQESITFRVVGGPHCADNLNWWQVSGPANINPGWIAERESPTGRYLIFPIEEDPTALCPEPLNLVNGSKMPLLNDVRIRQEPNLNALVLHVAPTGDTVTIISGPECIDTLNWWEIQVAWRGIIIQGWMAEGRFGATFVADPDAPSPDEICAPPMVRLRVGDRASVNVDDYKPKNLRAAPGLDGIVLATLIEGIPFDIIGGPICADNLNWWQIQVVSRPDVIGWLSEGGPGNWAIDRFTQDRLPGN